MDRIQGTTILAVRRDGLTVMAGDGQVSLDKTVLKHGARKVRTLADGKVLVGFAGGTADAITLFERFEAKLKDHSASLVRAAVEMAKEWRSDRVLRRLEALMLVADARQILLISGNGDVIEPDAAVMAIGSGGPFAQAAASALLAHSALPADRVAEEAMKIAADMCVFTNQQIVLERLS
jgi:ATP-dependent HslUV protease subunit HslV